MENTKRFKAWAEDDSVYDPDQEDNLTCWGACRLEQNIKCLPVSSFSTRTKFSGTSSSLTLTQAFIIYRTACYKPYDRETRSKSTCSSQQLICFSWLTESTTTLRKVVSIVTLNFLLKHSVQAIGYDHVPYMPPCTIIGDAM
jgi:hypothetical protein